VRALGWVDVVHLGNAAEFVQTRSAHGAAV
jgi:hypothetical protein